MPGPLHAFFVRVKARRGQHVAAVATARKIAVLVWHLLTREEDYAFAGRRSTRRSCARWRSRPACLPSGAATGRARDYSIKALRDAERAFVAQAEAAYGRFISAWSERPKAKRPAPKRPGYPDATTEERL